MPLKRFEPFYGIHGVGRALTRLESHSEAFQEGAVYFCSVLSPISMIHGQ